MSYLHIWKKKIPRVGRLLSVATIYVCLYKVGIYIILTQLALPNGYSDPLCPLCCPL